MSVVLSVQRDGLEASRLVATLALHEAALESMTHGVCAIDAAGRIVLLNRRFIEMCNLSSDVVRVGILFTDMLAHSSGRGNSTHAEMEAHHAKRLDLMAQGKPFSLTRKLSDGRTFTTHYKPFQDGGWLSLVEDVTEWQSREANLRLRFERYDRAVNHMSHGLCVTDGDSRIVLFNQLFLDMYDITTDVIHVGAHMRDVIADVARRGYFPNSTPEKVWAHRLQKMEGRKPFQQYQNLRSGNEYILHYHPMDDGGWVTLCEDVTTRHRMERELRQQFERFDHAINHMSHGLCMYGPDQRLIVCNKRYLEIYGLDPDVVRPGISHHDSIAHWIERGGQPGLTADEYYMNRKSALGSKDLATVQIALPNGRVIESTSRSTPDGGWVSAHEDVTDRIRYEDKLREQNILFNAAIGNMVQALCMYDADNRLIVSNEKYASFFNADPDVVKPGVTLYEVFEHGVARGTYPGVTADELYARRQSSIGEGGSRSYDQAMADGRTLAVSINSMSKGGWVGTFSDVTEQRRLEAERAAMLDELRRQNRLFDAALDNMAHGLCVFDKDWRIIVRNRRYLEIYGLTPDLAQPGTPLVDVMRHSVIRGVHTIGRTAEDLFEDFRRRVTIDHEPVLHRRLSDGRLIAVRHEPMQDGGWVGTYEDITARERADQEFKEQHRLFDVALNNMAHGLAMFDADFRIIVCNKRYHEMFNLSPGIARVGTTVREVFEHSIAVGNYRHTKLTIKEIYEDYVAQLKAGDTVVHRHLSDGRVVRVTHQSRPEGGWVAIYEDITERHRAEASIAHMARHDALTQLPNRLLLREKMAEGLASVDRSGESLAVFYLDLDNFKGINDTLGHPIGDKLLGTVADRIRSVVREEDTIARLGGDEFAILQRNSEPLAAGGLARRLVQLISEPMEIDGQEINTGVSIGIALAPYDGNAADHLMKCADLALYRSKAEGRGTFRFFEQDMDARIQQRRALEVDLRRALSAGEFSLAFQPQINLASNNLVAMEALLRWNHAERGPVPPSEFIPLAEEMGLIIPLGEWVLRHACAEAANWPDPIKVAVNLSPVQFRNRGLLTSVTQALAAARLAPHRLELEITEAVLLQDNETTVSMLHQLRALGVRVAMDDFGTGYSSLSYLRSFPFDKIKIDRSFIKDIERNRDSAVIIKAIAGLGQSLGIETTAEGIETQEQMDIVRRAGCTEMQGYLASPPRPAAEVPGLIARFNREFVAA
jgi:diguanylate cyclase (GGDEF)-like protein